MSRQLLQYEDGQLFARYRDLLRAQETKFNDEVLWEDGNDTEALRAEVYKTKLKLQLAYENPALSVGTSNSCFARLDFVCFDSHC